MSLLARVLDAIRPADSAAVGAAWRRQHALTKPRGSLGALEEVGARLAGIAGHCPPPVAEPVAVVVFAADHGVHAQGVTPWPQQVTAQMVANMTAGGAVVNALAAQVGAQLWLVDVGVAGPALPSADRFLDRRVRSGTRDFSIEPALTRDEVLAAIDVGIEVAQMMITDGHQLLVAGDMGIANTTTSAALIATFCQRDPADVTGRGTGIDDQVLAHKVDIIRQGLARHQPDPMDPLGVLANFGGLEHAAICGFLLAGSAARVPVIIDGVIAGAAAVAAQGLSAAAVGCWIAGHRSPEPGAGIALAQLGLPPLLDLEFRLGEGSGAVLAVPLVQAATRVLREVATFDTAGVSDTAGITEEESP